MVDQGREVRHERGSSPDEGLVLSWAGRPSAFLRVLAREALTRRQTCSLRRLLAPLVIILSRRSGQCTKGPRGPATLFAAFGSVQRAITSTFDEGGLSIPTDYTIQMSTGDPDPGSALLLPAFHPPPTLPAGDGASSMADKQFVPTILAFQLIVLIIWFTVGSYSTSKGSHLLRLPCDIRGA